MIYYNVRKRFIFALEDRFAGLRVTAKTDSLLSVGFHESFATTQVWNHSLTGKSVLTSLSLVLDSEHPNLVCYRLRQLLLVRGYALIIQN